MEKYKINEIHCREYLVDGELKKWDGDTSDWRSNVAEIRYFAENRPEIGDSRPL